MGYAATLHQRVSFAVLGTLLVNGAMLIGCNHGKLTLADYGDFYLEGRPEFFKLTARRKDGKFAEIYVELEDGRRMLLGDLPEDDAATLTDIPLGGHSTVMPTIDATYSSTFSILRYRYGSLEFASIHSSELRIKISSKLEGPYVQLPIDRATLIEVFGEPKRWKRVDPTGV